MANGKPQRNDEEDVLAADPADEPTESAPKSAPQLGRLSPARLDLLARLLAQQGRAPAPAASIPALPRQGDAPIFPLSFAQQRLWFLHQLAPDSRAYVIVALFQLRGPLDRPALRHALAGLERRHESLRTTFPARAGQPSQRIGPPRARPLPLIDLTALPSAACDCATRILLDDAPSQPFDLETGPLFRPLLIRLAAQEHVLLLALHHIIADGWSIGVLVRDLAALYTAARQGQPADLLALPIQYADFAVWQRAWVDADVRALQLAYWRDQLAGLATLALPADAAAPQRDPYAGSGVSAVIAPALRDQLHALIRQRGVTLFMALLAAFQALLARLSGQTDIVVGSPVANRTRAAVEPLIGCFVNTLALRTKLDGDPTVAALLDRVRTVTLGAFDHQDLPFEALVDALQPERDIARHPLFQALFVLQNTPLPSLRLTDLDLRGLPTPSAASAFDLALSLSESADGLLAQLEYRSAVFHPTSAQRILAQYQALLAGMVADPARRLSELPLLSRAERAQILVEWNDTLVAVGSRQSAVGSRQSAVGSSQSAVRSSQFAVRSQQSAVRSPQSAVRSRQSAVGSRQSAVRSPRLRSMHRSTS